MLWKLLIASFFIGSAYAMHLKVYLNDDSTEEILDGNLEFVNKQDVVLPIPEEQLPGMCWACKWAMKKVKRQLGNNASEDVIRKEVTKVCDSIGFLRGLCKRMINKFLDTLVEELSTTDDPITICANIGLCK